MLSISFKFLNLGYFGCDYLIMQAKKKGDQLIFYFIYKQINIYCNVG